MQGSMTKLPTGYCLEEKPHVLVLRHPDGAAIGAFSTHDVTAEIVRRVVEELARQEEWERDSPRLQIPDSSAQSLDATPSGLRAHFFGHFELSCEGEPLQLGRNGRALSIIKYLLANHPRPVSQDHLMGWLWPESSPKKARWSLNSAVHGLRKVLDGCPSSGGTVTYLLLEGGYYRLSPEIRIATDVEEFDGLYERGRVLERANRVEAAAALYEEALRLYRGDYLIEDLYDDWTMVERERLSNACVDMLDQLAVHYLESERPRDSVRCCYMALERDRCHEPSHRILMRCYARLGQRDRALKQYRLCERILSQEYNTAPSSEIQDLYRSITMEHANRPTG
jgi:DNA-binding SARP family transcriptional activator